MAHVVYDQWMTAQLIAVYIRSPNECSLHAVSAGQWSNITAITGYGSMWVGNFNPLVPNREGKLRKVYWARRIKMFEKERGWTATFAVTVSQRLNQMLYCNVSTGKKRNLTELIYTLSSSNQMLYCIQRKKMNLTELIYTLSKCQVQIRCSNVSKGKRGI